MRRSLPGALALLACACSHAPPVPPEPPRPLTTSKAPTPAATRTEGKPGPIDSVTQSDIDGAVDRGRSGDAEGAERAFQAIVDRNPNAGPAWVNLGVLA